MLVSGRVCRLLVMAVLSGVGTVGLVAPAEAQDSYPATVTSVVDGDTVDAQVAGGPALEVQLIGINAPELGDCGADEATRYMERFVLGRAVTLVSDPTQPRLDGSGRSLLYVDRDDSLDVGEAILRAGWAEVFLRENDFARLPAYMATEQTAQRFSKERGVAAVGTSTQIAARSFATSAYRHSRTRRYYRRLSNRQFATAWGMLSRRVRRDFGPVASWKAGFRRSLSTTVTAARARLSGRRVVVSVAAPRPRPRRVHWQGGPPALPGQVDSRSPPGRLGCGEGAHAQDRRRPRPAF